MLTVTPEILFGQSLIHPECKGIHYTDKQDKKCLECILNDSKKDSLINNLSIRLSNLNEAGTNCESQKTILNNLIELHSKSLVKANRKVRILGYVIKVGIPVSIIGGFYLATSLN